MLRQDIYKSKQYCPQATKTTPLAAAAEYRRYTPFGELTQAFPAWCFLSATPLRNIFLSRQNVQPTLPFISLFRFIKKVVHSQNFPLKQTYSKNFHPAFSLKTKILWIYGSLLLFSLDPHGFLLFICSTHYLQFKPLSSTGFFLTAQKSAQTPTNESMPDALIEVLVNRWSRNRLIRKSLAAAAPVICAS